MTEIIDNSELIKFRTFLAVLRGEGEYSFLQWIKNKDHYPKGGSAGVTWFERDEMPGIEIKKGHDLYFGVNATDKALSHEKGYAIPPSEDDICFMRCLYGDFDEKGLDNILQLQYPPHVVIETSPQKYHAYFMLKRALKISDKNRAQIKEILGYWVGMIGADEKAKDLRRILRVAGTQNWKKANADSEGNPFQARFIKCDLNPDNFYNYADLQSITLQYARRLHKQKERRDSVLPQQPSSAKTETKDSIPHDSLDKMYQTCLSRVASTGEGNRNGEINKIAHFLARWAARGLFNEADIRRDIFNAAVSNGYVNEHGDKDVYRVIESAIQSGKQNPMSDMEIEKMKRGNNRFEWEGHRDLNLSQVPEDIETIETNAISTYQSIQFALKVLEGTETIDPPVPCLIPPIKHLMPYHPIGELTAIAGGTGQGKTQVFYGMSQFVVTVLNEDCYFFGPEWRLEDWAERHLVRYGNLSQLEVDHNKTYFADIADGKTPREARGEAIPENRMLKAKRLVEQQLGNEGGRVFMPRNYSVGFTEILEDIRNVIYRERAKGRKIRTVFWDYMQVLTPPMGMDFSYYEYASSQLAELARALRLAIFVGSQLTAETEKQLRDNRPALTHSLRYLTGNQYKNILTIQLKYKKEDDVPVPYVDKSDGTYLGRFWNTKSNKGKSMWCTSWQKLNLARLEWGF